jgi:hypothetical protein
MRGRGRGREGCTRLIFRKLRDGGRKVKTKSKTIAKKTIQNINQFIQKHEENTKVRWKRAEEKWGNRWQRVEAKWDRAVQKVKKPLQRAEAKWDRAVKDTIYDPWDEAAEKYVWVPTRPGSKPGSRVGSPEPDEDEDEAGAEEE